MYICCPSWTRLPPSSPSHPSGSSQCTSPEHPVSGIEPGLEICFTCDNIHVSNLFSQIIPSLPSPRVQKTILYICVSFAVTYRVIVTIFLNSIYMLFLHKRLFYISLIFVNLCLISFSRVVFIVQFLFFERWGHLNKKLYTHQITPPISPFPIPWQLPFYPLLLWIWPFWVLHISGIMLCCSTVTGLFYIA